MVGAFLGNEPGRLSASLEPARAERRRRQRTRRQAAWIIRSLNQSLLPGTQWADCGNPVGRYVQIKELTGSDGVMQPSSIATCKSPWACLSCAAKIRSVRAREVDHTCKAHLAVGGGVTFITLTFPHGLGDSLKASLATVVKGWKCLVSGAGYYGNPLDQTDARPRRPHRTRRRRSTSTGPGWDRGSMCRRSTTNSCAPTSNTVAVRTGPRGRSPSTPPKPATVGTWPAGSNTAKPPKASGSSPASTHSARSTPPKKPTSPTKKESSGRGTGRHPHRVR